MRELTEKQREFCRLVVTGSTKAEAYRKAFNRNDMTMDAARQAGNRLSRKAHVSAFCDTLRHEADSEAVLSRQERMTMLSNMARQSERAGNVADAVRSIKELNLMDGAYEPEKLEVSGALGVGAVVAALQERDLDLAGR